MLTHKQEYHFTVWVTPTESVDHRICRHESHWCLFQRKQWLSVVCRA